jgi:hypothetical protein
MTYLHCGQADRHVASMALFKISLSSVLKVRVPQFHVIMEIFFFGVTSKKPVLFLCDQVEFERSGLYRPMQRTLALILPFWTLPLSCFLLCREMQTHHPLYHKAALTPP